MTDHYDILLKAGFVVDPVNQRKGVMDVAIENGKVSEIAQDIAPSSASQCIKLENKLVVPGIIDLHVHASSWLGGKFAHKMMARAGVTTALDMSGPVNSVLGIAEKDGAGLNLACLQQVRAEHSVKSQNPTKKELRALLQKTLSEGGYGLKVLGGHYPLTPEGTARVFEVAYEKGAYVAFHAGTLKTKSNIEGFKEAVELAQDYPVHLAHINSYCRGTVKPCMAETEAAIEALKEHANICSESYLSPLNGTSATCVGGIPESRVTAMCLTKGGFPATEKGLEDAIMAGWAQINVDGGGEMTLAGGKDAVKWWRAKGTDTTVSFNVNPEIPRLRLATARRESGDFVVDCISTDGGGIPRNVIVEMGLSLVKLQALSIEEFVIKTSRNPARLLGLKNKGHLGIGSDADITVMDPSAQKAVMTLVNGEVTMWQGHVCGTGCSIITTPAGENAVKERGLRPIVVDTAEIPVCRRYLNV